MAELRALLRRLDLTEYASTFIEEGFDSWQTLTDITESDLNDLGVKLGHRRKLQRAIAESKGQNVAAQSPQVDTSRCEVSPDASSSRDAVTSNSPTTNSGPIRTKRKYRRHPKPDANAPERPASAYVRFSNRMRQELADQDLSFIQMAKVVGDRWQALPSQEREWFESQAAADKENYNAQMSRYKRTEDYARYQQYLADFKLKSAGNRDQKRAKHDGDYSGSSRRGSVASEPYHVDPLPSLSHIPPQPLYGPISSHSPKQSSARQYHTANGYDRLSASAGSARTSFPISQDPSRLPTLETTTSASSRSSATLPPVPDLITSASRSGTSKSPMSNSLPSLSSVSSSTDPSSCFDTPLDSSRALPPLHLATGPKKLHDSATKIDDDAEPNPRHTGALAALLRAGEVMSARESDHPAHSNAYGASVAY